MYELPKNEEIFLHGWYAIVTLLNEDTVVPTKN